MVGALVAGTISSATLHTLTDIYGKGAKGKATRLHAQIVRDRGACECCGSTHHLQCAHIISRKYSWTRTSLENAFCLCAKCHRHFTDNPVEFGTFTIEKVGQCKYDELIRLRETLLKFDWDTEAQRLYDLAKERRII